jgi:hypothetical protein
MRSVVLSILVAAATLPALVASGSMGSVIPSPTAVLCDTQTFSFDPTGVIQLERSFGDVRIEGWDRPEVEITTIRSTHARKDAAQAERDLDKISITAVKQGEDLLKITTDYSSGVGHSLRTKPETDLKYVIKAPAKAKIVVHHDVGQVKLVNLTGDVEVTNRIGDIGLLLRNPRAYRVDARARVGGVESDFGCSAGLSHQLRTHGEAGHPQLYLRVGVGDITIRTIRS